MMSVSLGPLAFPVGPLVILCAIWTAVWLSRRLATDEQKDLAERTVWQAVLLSLIAARAAHIALNWQAYLEHPWSIIDIRDGGWSAPAALAAGLGWLAIQLLRKPLPRRAVLTGALVGISLWGVAKAGLWWSDSQANRQSVPGVLVNNPRTNEMRPLDEITRGKPTVINLWATWCGPCRIEMPLLAKSQAENPDVQFIFLNEAETAEQIDRFVRKEQLTLANIWIDVQRQFGLAVGSQGLPTTLFYDATGQRVDAHFGIISAAALRIQVERLQQIAQ